MHITAEHSGMQIVLLQVIFAEMSKISTMFVDTYNSAEYIVEFYPTLNCCSSFVLN